LENNINTCNAFLYCCSTFQTWNFAVLTEGEGWGGVLRSNLGFVPKTKKSVENSHAIANEAF
jgi:hypothetical protein